MPVHEEGISANGLPDLLVKSLGERIACQQNRKEVTIARMTPSKDLKMKTAQFVESRDIYRSGGPWYSKMVPHCAVNQYVQEETRKLIP